MLLLCKKIRNNKCYYKSISCSISKDILFRRERSLAIFYVVFPLSIPCSFRYFVDILHYGMTKSVLIDDMGMLFSLIVSKKDRRQEERFVPLNAVSRRASWTTSPQFTWLAHLEWSSQDQLNDHVECEVKCVRVQQHVGGKPPALHSLTGIVDQPSP